VVTQVEELDLGDQLVAPAALSATVLYLEDVTDFTETGGVATVNGTQLAYTAVSYDDQTMTLAAPLGAALPVDTQVWVWPDAVAVTAYVLVDGADEATPVTVPHNLQDAFPLGIREEDDREEVVLERDGMSWAVRDVPRRRLIRDGSFLNSDTLPSPSEYLGPVVPDQLVDGIFAANWVLAGQFSTSGDAGANRVEMDNAGLRVYGQDVDADGQADLQIDLPSNGAPSMFAGTVKADTVEAPSLTMTADAEVRAGATLRLSAGITAPGTAPTAETYWAVPFNAGLTSVVDAVWSASDSKWYIATSGSIVTCSATGTGITFLTSISLDVKGITKVGDNFYVIGINRDSGAEVLRRYAAGFSALVETTVLFSADPIDRDLAIGTDGTSLLIASRATGYSSYVLVYHTGLQYLGEYNLPGGAFPFPGAPTGVGMGSYDFGASRLWVAGGGSVYTYTTSGWTATRSTAGDFPQPGAMPVNWNGTEFLSVGPLGKFYRHNGATRSAPATYQTAYTLYDAVGTVHETTRSPLRTLTMRRRTFIRLTGALPYTNPGADEPDRLRFYIGTTSTDSNMYRVEGAQGGNSVSITTVPTSGGHYGVTSRAAPFETAGTPAQVVNGAGTVLMDGNGFRQEAWRTVGAAGQPAFTNGWSAVGAYPPQFRRDALGNVHLRGAVQSGTLGAAAFTLPAGYAPSPGQALAYLPVTNGSTKGQLLVTEAGEVIPSGLGGTTPITVHLPTVYSAVV
jgi:hypothetical protein